MHLDIIYFDSRANRKAGWRRSTEKRRCWKDWAAHVSGKRQVILVSD